MVVVATYHVTLTWPGWWISFNRRAQRSHFESGAGLFPVLLIDRNGIDLDIFVCDSAAFGAQDVAVLAGRDEVGDADHIWDFIAPPGLGVRLWLPFRFRFRFRFRPRRRRIGAQGDRQRSPVRRRPRRDGCEGGFRVWEPWDVQGQDPAGDPYAGRCERDDSSAASEFRRRPE